MTYDVYMAESAEADLAAIFDYSSEHFSLEVAKNTVRGLRDAILQLTLFPEGFINFDERIGHKIFPEGRLRMLPSKRYLIFYLVRDHRVDVLQIIHSHTDYLNHLETLFSGILNKEENE